MKTEKGVIARMVTQIAIDNTPTQPATTPIKILSSLSKYNVPDCFDITIATKDKNLEIDFHSGLQTLMDALTKFNGLKKLEDVKPPMYNQNKN